MFFNFGLGGWRAAATSLRCAPALKSAVHLMLLDPLCHTYYEMCLAFLWLFFILPVYTLIIAYFYPCFAFRGTLFEYGLSLVIPGVSDVLSGLLSRSCRVSELTCCLFLHTPPSSQFIITLYLSFRTIKGQVYDTGPPNSSRRSDRYSVFLVRVPIVPGLETVA
jgi:hypothetical protein